MMMEPWCLCMRMTHNYLSDVASKRANITFVASNLLGTEKPYNNKSTNAGGWADSTLNTWLNTRMVTLLVM